LLTGKDIILGELLGFLLFGIIAVLGLTALSAAKKGASSLIKGPEPTSPTPTPSRITVMSEIDEKPIYARAMAECDQQTEQRDAGRWAKAFSVADGDLMRTRAKYIELRVNELIQAEKQRRESLNSKENSLVDSLPIRPSIPEHILSNSPVVFQWEGRSRVNWAVIIEPNSIRFVNLFSAQEISVAKSDAHKCIELSTLGPTKEEIKIKHYDGTVYTYSANPALCTCIINWICE
jgi:hypothetical protein